MERRTLLLCAAACAALALASAAGAQTLLRDIRPGTPNPSVSSDIQAIRSLGAIAVVFADDGRLGTEVWRTDGTTAGTFLVRDVRPGPSDGVDSPHVAFVWNGAVYFEGDDGAASGLWRTDGTPAGTYALRTGINIANGQRGSFGVGPGGLYFAASASPHGGELWRTDGTVAGTQLVADINPGSASSMTASTPPVFAQVGTELFFAANDGTSGVELWKTDGTAANTSRVADVTAGTAGTSFMKLLDLNGALLFTAMSGSPTRSWFRSDASGTVRLSTDHVLSTEPDEYLVHNGRVLFQGSTSTEGNEPWVTDGTPTGTQMLANIHAGNLASGPHGFTPFLGEVWFAASSDVYGNELWRTDGTPGGTVLALDTIPGLSSTAPMNVTLWNGALYFSGAMSGAGRELWRCDGATAAMVKDIRPGAGNSSPGPLVATQGGLVFSATDGVNGTELWVTDGTSANTRLCADLSVATLGSDPDAFATVRGRAFFTADDGTHGVEPWTSDGTPVGTQLLLDTRPGAGSSGVGSFTAWRDAAWFTSDLELWRSDGTPAGTAVADASIAYEGDLVAAGDRLWSLGPSLGVWRSDGTAGGAVLVKAFNSALLPVGPSRLVAHGAEVLFQGGNGTTTPGGLWRSDGTPTGTRLVHSYAQLPSSSPLFDVASDGINAWYALWDGTHLTVHVAVGSAASIEVYRSAPNANPFFTPPAVQLTPLGGEAFFVVSDAASGMELWRTNGIAPATLFADTRLGPDSGEPSELVTAGGVLFFSADDGVNGREPWHSDGTPAGTAMTSDAALGAGGSNPRGFFAAGDGPMVLFRAEVPGLGAEPWVSDGSASGTYPLADLALGSASPDVVFGAIANATVVLRANDGVTGAEVWSLPVRSFAGVLARAYGAPCTGTNGRAPRIGADGLPRLGALGFAVTVRDGLAGSAAGLLISLVPTSVPLPGGCSLLTGPVLASVTVPLDATGSGAVVLAVGPSTALLGFQLAHQFAVLDAGGPLFGLGALSDALLMLVGA